MFPPNPLSLLYATDSSVTRSGKIRGANLPPEYLLERCVSELTFSDPTWNSGTSACKWTGIECTADEEVIEMNWDEISVRGTILLEFLPETLQIVTLQNTGIMGTIPCGKLPRHLHEFTVSQNNLSGALDLCALPASLLTFNVFANLLSGNLNLSALPEQIREMRFHVNRFVGELSLTNLPDTCVLLSFSKNQFTGPLDLSHIPVKIEYLWLITGIVDLTPLRRLTACKVMDLSYNEITEFIGSRESAIGTRAKLSGQKVS